MVFSPYGRDPQEQSCRAVIPNLYITADRSTLDNFTPARVVGGLNRHVGVPAETHKLNNTQLLCSAYFCRFLKEKYYRESQEQLILHRFCSVLFKLLERR
ncbi:hypothetical protein ATANTOWER_016472 [Ataeniobius toweri]|uniref:Uncharacterized protein n=1 Tax=Ataeniobius toweri TaxID=208326 RepID=A0ABU7CBJ8_9TELE|nr:hypothetical protein [Ataeniobius toweri]